MGSDDASPQQSLGELFRLTKAYAIQETVAPLKGLSKFVGLGVAAAIVGSVAIILMLLGILRMVQYESKEHLTGHLTWVPYLIVLLIAVIAMVIALRAIASKKGGDA